jgi:WD40 repeat protein
MNVAPLFAPEIDQGQAAAIAFAPDSRTLAVSSGPSVMLFSAAGGSAVGLLEDLGGPVEALAYSPDGALLAAGGGSELQLWDPAAQTMLVALEGHTGAILDLKFSPGGRWLASAAADQTILFWDIPAILDGAPPSPTSVIYAHDAEVFCLAFSPDGSLLASGGLDRRVRLWAVPLQGDLPLTGAWLPLGSIVGFEGMPGSLAFSPDGRYLAAAAWDGLLRLYGLPPE